MRSVKFSNSDTMELVAIIKEKDHVCVDAFMEPSGIWLRSPNEETELRLLTLGDFQVTVSRVCFSHKRAGCMTAIFGWLKNFCKRNGIPRIVIQSVETKEMSNWCIKNGFQPDDYASMPIGGFVIGNYLLDCF